MQNRPTCLRPSTAFLVLTIQAICGQLAPMASKIATRWSSVSAMHSRLARPIRSSYDSDPGAQDSKPELEASHKPDHTVLKCTVRNPRPNADVYVSCPALGSNALASACYQGCRPTKPCATLDKTEEVCVPNEQSVFCQSYVSNGTIVLNLLLHRTDPRLAGVWFCSHAGMESTKFEVSLEHPSVNQNLALKPVNPKPVAEKERTPTPQYRKISQEDQNGHVNNHPLAQIRKPLVVFGVLAVLALSLLVNMVFCIRCLLLRSYIDAVQENGKHLSCLAHCLCLSKELRKASESLKSPKLPRSANWTPLYGQSGLHHASAQLVYPLPVGQHSPVFLGPRPSINLAPMHGLSSASLPGTLRHYGQTRGVISLPPADGMQNSRISCDQLPDGSLLVPQQSLLHGIHELGTANHYLPSYIRVPSVNTPSPNLSQRLASTTQSESVRQVQNLEPGTIGNPENTSQYVLQMQPSVVRGHVVYDDVAIGNPNTLGRYSRFPNGTLADMQPAMFQMSHPYPYFSTKQFHFTGRTSNVEPDNQPASLRNEVDFQTVNDAQLEVAHGERNQSQFDQQENTPSSGSLGVPTERSPLIHRLSNKCNK